MKEDKVYLQHILGSIANIEQFIQGFSKDDFIKNVLVNSAVIRQLEIIGEAVKNLSYELKKTQKDLPWKDIAGLRDKLIHEYFGVDLSLVWIICKKNIPELKRSVKELLNQAF